MFYLSNKIKSGYINNLYKSKYNDINKAEELVVL